MRLCGGIKKIMVVKPLAQGFPGGPVVRNLPASAGDSFGTSIPGRGRVHTPRGNQVCVPQLRKPVHLEPGLGDKRRHCSEQPGRRDDNEPPLVSTRDSLGAAVKMQPSQELKTNIHGHSAQCQHTQGTDPPSLRLHKAGASAAGRHKGGRPLGDGRVPPELGN